MIIRLSEMDRRATTWKAAADAASVKWGRYAEAAMGERKGAAVERPSSMLSLG